MGNMGIPEAELKSMAGHSDIRTTNRYITASVSNKTKNILTDGNFGECAVY